MTAQQADSTPWEVIPDLSHPGFTIKQSFWKRFDVREEDPAGGLDADGRAVTRVVRVLNNVMVYKGKARKIE